MELVWKCGKLAEKYDLARNALMKGFSIDVIHEITGLDKDAIKSFQI
jgi:hypothetical protein